MSLIEARDYAHAATLNLETALAHPRAQGLSLYNAAGHLQKALDLLRSLETKQKEEPATPGRVRPVWKKAAKGAVTTTRWLGFNLFVGVERGFWKWTVRSADGKRVSANATTSKKLAQQQAIASATFQAQQRDAAEKAKRTAGVGYDKLEQALERARQDSANAKSPSWYDGTSLATLDDVHSIIDSFVSVLIRSLEPEAG